MRVSVTLLAQWLGNNAFMHFHPLLAGLLISVGLQAMAQTPAQIPAQVPALSSRPPAPLKPVPEIAAEKQADRFPGDPAEHRVVYMFNQADTAYQTAVLNSVQAMIKTYGDNVTIAVVAIGPGIHVLARHPRRKVDAEIAARVDNFAKSYGVRFIACGNTMSTVGYAEADMKPYAEYALVGAAALMRLQEEGFRPIYW